MVIPIIMGIPIITRPTVILIAMVILTRGIMMILHHHQIIIPQSLHRITPIVKITGMMAAATIIMTRSIRRNLRPAQRLMLREENGLSRTGNILMRVGFGLTAIGKNNNNPNQVIIKKALFYSKKSAFVLRHAP